MIISVAIIAILLSLPLGTSSTIKNRTTPTEIKEIEKDQGEINIDLSSPEAVIKSLQGIKDMELEVTKNKEEVLWQNKKTRKILDIATITGNLVEIKIKSTKPIKLLSGDETLNVDDYGIYLKWYKLSAKNAWGWTMFWLCARGFFIFNGPIVFTFPLSYSGVDWWCDWAWSKGGVAQQETKGDNWAQIYTECQFKHDLTGQTVDLWAYIKCFSDGKTVGDGGAL
jgi:hypothetical protein